MTLKKSCTCSSKYLNDFIKKAIALNKGCNTMYCARDPALKGGISGRAPQMTTCAPPNENCAPKRELCPEEINRFGVTGVQVEAQMGVCHRYCRDFCGLSPDFMTFLG